MTTYIYSYRVVVSDDHDYPFNVQRKGWIFWTVVNRCRNLREADDYIHTAIRNLAGRKPGTVVKEYNSRDQVADMLKGNTR